MPPVARPLAPNPNLPPIPPEFKVAAGMLADQVRGYIGSRLHLAKATTTFGQLAPKFGLAMRKAGTEEEIQVLLETMPVVASAKVPPLPEVVVYPVSSEMAGMKGECMAFPGGKVAYLRLFLPDMTYGIEEAGVEGFNLPKTPTVKARYWYDNRDVLVSYIEWMMVHELTHAGDRSRAAKPHLSPDDRPGEIRAVAAEIVAHLPPPPSSPVRGKALSEAVQKLTSSPWCKERWDAMSDKSKAYCLRYVATEAMKRGW